MILINILPNPYIKPSHYKKEINPSASLCEGYQYFTDKNHPLASGYFILYHRHRMSVKLNRWINKNELVHHKDENKLNNNLDNLEVITRKNHILLHVVNPLKDIICIGCKKLFHPRDHNRQFCSRMCWFNHFDKDDNKK